MRKNISVEFTNERIIPSGGLAVVGAIPGKSDFVKRCNRMKAGCNHPQHQIKNGDIMLLYIGMQCMGKPSFDAVHEMDDDPDFYKDALGICYAIQSAEIQRHRTIKTALRLCPGLIRTVTAVPPCLPILAGKAILQIWNCVKGNSTAKKVSRSF